MGIETLPSAADEAAGSSLPEAALNVLPWQHKRPYDTKGQELRTARLWCLLSDVSQALSLSTSITCRNPCQSLASLACVFYVGGGIGSQAARVSLSAFLKGCIPKHSVQRASLICRDKVFDELKTIVGEHPKTMRVRTYSYLCTNACCGPQTTLSCRTG